MRCTVDVANAAGVTTDILVYSMIVPIIPFRLQDLGYSDVSGLVGWLLFAYVRSLRCRSKRDAASDQSSLVRSDRDL